MRTTIVPAQITTVEDRIAGSLGVSQLLLLVAPIFGGSAIFVILPPFFNYAVYKVVFITCVAVLCALLAIRIKGRIVLFWIAILLRYNLRPRYYVFDKNDSYLRDIGRKVVEEATEETAKPQKKVVALPQLSTTEIARLEQLIADQQINLHFKTNRKGELYAYFTEVK